METNEKNVSGLFLFAVNRLILATTAESGKARKSETASSEIETTLS